MAQTQTPPRTTTSPPEPAAHDGQESHEAWAARTRVVLTPLAAPSILGLYGFAGATFIVAANMAGWYGGSSSALYLFPFAGLFGGLAQFLAGMWSYRARDGLATAMHGMWGAFWMAYALLYAFIAVGVFAQPSPTFPELGYWFIVLSAITFVGAAAAVAESAALFAVLLPLAVGAALAAVSFLTTLGGWTTAAGYAFIVSAVIAFYLASAMMLEESAGRVVLPLGKYTRASNHPGTRVSDPLSYDKGMPGLRKGQ